MFSNIRKDHNGDSLKFILENFDNNLNIGYVNALRRIIISEIPANAIDPQNITFYKNTSMLHDDILSNRLSLVPIFNDPALVDSVVELNMTNNDNDIKQITMNNFTVSSGGKSITDIFPHTNILFAKLKFSQQIHLSAKIGRNIARRNNAAYCNVCTAVVSFVRDNNKITAAIKDKGLKQQDEINNFMLSQADRYYMTNEDGTPSAFIFSIETNHSISPGSVFAVSLEVLIAKLETINSSLVQKNADKIAVKKSETTMEAFDFEIKMEDDTLGNLLNYYLNKNNDVYYAGYLIPHPSYDRLIVRTALKDNNTIENNITLIQKTINDIILITKDLQQKWSLISEKNYEESQKGKINYDYKLQQHLTKSSKSETTESAKTESNNSAKTESNNSVKTESNNSAKTESIKAPKSAKTSKKK